MFMLSDDLFQELDSKFQNVGKASAIDIDLVRYISLAINTSLKAKHHFNFVGITHIKEDAEFDMKQRE
jgi:hypothetical protein